MIVTDLRGLGCSERSSPYDVLPLETMMEDVALVLDAVGSRRTAILATGHAGLVAIMFAATYPERTTAIILSNTAANYLWSEETPWEYTEEQWQEYMEETGEWSRADARQHVLTNNPSMSDDPEYIEWWYRYCLLSEANGAAIASTRKFMYTDVRTILPSVHVPALVLLRPDGDPLWIESARYLATQMPEAKLQELPGKDQSLWVGDQKPLHRAVSSFLGDVYLDDSELERVLATVLFTDIVSSTEKIAELGDHAWRELVERHHAAVRVLLGRYRGVEVDTAGDGFFASFDGPARAIRCARAIVEEVRPLGIEVRAGLHTGECERINGKLGGIAVNIGARVGAAAHPSEVLVSQTVKDLVAGSGLTFAGRGEHELKGVPGKWRLFAVTT